jgi:hypothetical protein
MPNLPIWVTSQDSRPWTVLSRVSAIFGIVAPVSAITAYFLTGNISVPAAITAIYLCVLASALIVLLLRQEQRYLRDARYAPALLQMRRAYTELASASWHLYHGDSSQEAFRLRLRESLRRLAEAYTLVTGYPCRACIKMIQAPPGTLTGDRDLLVSTLCRDNEEGDPPRHAPDRIGENTDFKQIFTENAMLFFSNDLIAQLKRGYRNSHWREEDIEKGNLDYLATIVWPIERSLTPYALQPQQREIIGFLCVDTKQVKTFQKTYDEALGASFAQTLYLVLHKLREQPPESTVHDR